MDKLTFVYDFSNYIFDAEPFTFEADYGDAIDYLVRTHSKDDLIKEYIDKWYEKESDGDKETLKTYDGFDGTYDSIKNMSEDTKKEFIDEVFFYILYHFDDYYDELKDYYEQEAYDIWSDMD